MKRFASTTFWAVLAFIIALTAAAPQGAAAQRSGERSERAERGERGERAERTKRTKQKRKDSARAGSRGARVEGSDRAARSGRAARRPNVKNERARRGERSAYNYRSAHYRPVQRHYARVRVSWPIFVHVDARWSRSRAYRGERLAVDVDYRHRVVYSDAHMTVLRIEIEEIDIRARGRYLGEVRRIPRDMRTIEATVYRNGDVEFDRDIYVTGDSRRGYRLVMDDGYRYQIGYVDLRRGRVSKVYHSDVAPRLGDRISLLPDNADWLY